MIIDNIKSLICCIIAVLLLLGVCMTVDYADTDITVSNMNQSKTIELTNTTVLKDTHYILENDSGVARVQLPMVQENIYRLLPTLQKIQCTLEEP